MEELKRTWRNLVYTFSTEDRYADFNPNEYMQTQNGSMVADGLNSVNGSQIQLNEFFDGGELGGNDGVSECLLAWRHIASWCSEHNADLYATLSEPCTRNDISRAERDLSVTFPAAVRASLRLHDGQEDVYRMQGTSGLIYGFKLMSLDEIVHMTMTWRSVATKLQAQAVREEQRRMEQSSSDLSKPTLSPQAMRQKKYNKVESQDYNTTKHLQKDISQNYNKQFKMDKIPKQGSVPPMAVQPVYAHPGWIPMVTDDAGNHIGIDLAPGPKGRYAQVILFGRDFDTKFVLANNWGDFLLDFVNDLENGNWLLVDNSDDYLNGEGDLVYVQKGTQGPILDYFAVLRKRSWDKWQRSKPTPATPPAAPVVPVNSSTTAVNNSLSSLSRSDIANETMIASKKLANVSALTSEDSVAKSTQHSPPKEKTAEAQDSGSSVKKTLQNNKGEKEAEETDKTDKKGSTSSLSSPVASTAALVETKVTPSGAAEDEAGEAQQNTSARSPAKSQKDENKRNDESITIDALHDEFENVAL